MPAKIDKVCSGCGKKLVIRTFKERHGSQISTNDFPVCERCSLIEYGVSKKIYEITKKFVKGYDFKGKYTKFDKTDKENFIISVREACAYINYISYNGLLK